MTLHWFWASERTTSFHYQMPSHLCIWVKVFKNGPSKICGRQSSTNFTWSIPEYLDPSVTLAANIYLQQLYSACSNFLWCLLQFPFQYWFYKESQKGKTSTNPCKKNIFWGKEIMCELSWFWWHIYSFIDFSKKIWSKVKWKCYFHKEYWLRKNQ